MIITLQRSLQCTMHLKWNCFFVINLLVWHCAIIKWVTYVCFCCSLQLHISLCCSLHLHMHACMYVQENFSTRQWVCCTHMYFGFCSSAHSDLSQCYMKRCNEHFPSPHCPGPNANKRAKVFGKCSNGEVFFIRHAESEVNKEARWLGAESYWKRDFADSRLTHNGKDQAKHDR